MTAIEVSERDFAVTVPVLIVGAGAAGLVAALSARERDAEVLVLERDPLPRGSTAMSAGLVPAAGTRWQAQAGIADSPAALAADIMAKAGNEPDPGLVRLVTETVGPALEWLGEAHGLPFAVVEDFRYPGHSALRMHGLPSRSGEELVDRLRAAAETAGVDIVCDAQVLTLVAGEDGSVRGAVYARPDGGREEIGCKTLVLACNGYGGNRELVARHIPDMAAAPYFGHAGNRGDALLWGEALGGVARHLSGHQGHGAIAHPLGVQITWATVMEGGFQVNAEGRRFADEAAGYSEQAAIVLKQPGGIAWQVFDERIAGIASRFEDFRQAVAAGAVLEAPTPEALAEAMHVPPAALADTMRNVAAAKRGEAPDAFGRDFAGVPQLAPPYRAVRVTGALLHTQGGLVVDGEARVVRREGGPLPNLFAAGGAACGVSGGRAAGYLSGNGLLTAIAFGRIAGLAAARQAGMV